MFTDRRSRTVLFVVAPRMVVCQRTLTHSEHQWPVLMIMQSDVTPGFDRDLAHTHLPACHPADLLLRQIDHGKHVGMHSFVVCGSNLLSRHRDTREADHSGGSHSKADW